MFFASRNAQRGIQSLSSLNRSYSLAATPPWNSSTGASPPNPPAPVGGWLLLHKIFPRSNRWIKSSPSKAPQVCDDEFHCAANDSRGAIAGARSACIKVSLAPAPPIPAAPLEEFLQFRQYLLIGTGFLQGFSYTLYFLVGLHRRVEIGEYAVTIFLPRNLPFTPYPSPKGSGELSLPLRGQAGGKVAIFAAPISPR